MLIGLACGVCFAAGIALLLPTGARDRVLASLARAEHDPQSRQVGSRRQNRTRTERRLSVVAVIQLTAAPAGLLLGWISSGLLGLALLLGGLGVLLPPFMAAPSRRRHHTRVAEAWATWSRELAELARAGSGLLESLKGSVEHAPDEIAHVVRRVAVTADLFSMDEAFEELAKSGETWEPEVAAGLRMAAESGAAVAQPLLDLSGRIHDVVELHRAKTEGVVQLWTQTITLLSLAALVVVMMFRNNPSYFDPYSLPVGQTVFVLIAALLLGSTGFLVFHSVVRDENSVLVAPRRRSRAKDPL